MPLAACSAQRPDRKQQVRQGACFEASNRARRAPAGSGRTARLDPLALPVRFTASDAVADERVRHVELHRERVILRRAVQGMRIALNVPVQAFLGVVDPAHAGAERSAGRRRRVSRTSRSGALDRALFGAEFGRRRRRMAAVVARARRAVSGCRQRRRARPRRSRCSARCASRRRRNAAAAARR